MLVQDLLGRQLLDAKLAFVVPLTGVRYEVGLDVCRFGKRSAAVVDQACV